MLARLWKFPWISLKTSFSTCLNRIWSLRKCFCILFLMAMAWFLTESKSLGIEDTAVRRSLGVKPYWKLMSPGGMSSLSFSSLDRKTKALENAHHCRRSLMYLCFATSFLFDATSKYFARLGMDTWKEAMELQ